MFTEFNSKFLSCVTERNNLAVTMSLSYVVILKQQWHWVTACFITPQDTFTLMFSIYTARSVLQHLLLLLIILSHNQDPSLSESCLGSFHEVPGLWESEVKNIHHLHQLFSAQLCSALCVSDGRGDSICQQGDCINFVFQCLLFYFESDQSI